MNFFLTFCDFFQTEDIKLDVQHAREAPTEHPQWEFEDEDEDENSNAKESDDQVISRPVLILLKNLFLLDKRTLLTIKVNNSEFISNSSNFDSLKEFVYIRQTHTLNNKSQ